MNYEVGASSNYRGCEFLEGLIKSEKLIKLIDLTNSQNKILNISLENCCQYLFKFIANNKILLFREPMRRRSKILFGFLCDNDRHLDNAPIIKFIN